MFFEDKPASLREMMRVLQPGGHLAVAVCDALDHSPGYTAFADLLRKLFGDRVADGFRRPFVLGDPQLLLSLCADAGIFSAKVTRHEGVVHFSSIQSLVSAERACVWTLGGMLDDAQFSQLLKESEQALRPFVASDGTLAFTMPALIVTAAKACAELTPETFSSNA
jgi:trans-aconitate methyltransferase